MRTGSIKQKIEEALVTGPCGRAIMRLVDADKSPCAGCGRLRSFAGALFYGFAFIPFVFALLQQSNTDRHGIDPFAPDGKISACAWRAGFIYLGAVIFYCVVAFTFLSEGFYVDGSVKLTCLLATVVVAIWMQQALTLRYIFLRPQLSHLVKRRDKRFNFCCKRVTSTFDHKNVMNYAALSVVVAEFLLFASVCFHSSLPWHQGSGEVDAPIAQSLQGVLPEFLAGRVESIKFGITLSQLFILLLGVFVYICLLGDIIFRKLDAFSAEGTLACELIAGTLFTTITGRLLLLAGSDLGDASRFLRVLAMLAAFIFATTATFVATMRVQPPELENERKTIADIRFKPKCAARSPALPPSPVAYGTAPPTWPPPRAVGLCLVAPRRPPCPHGWRRADGRAPSDERVAVRTGPTGRHPRRSTPSPPGFPAR